MTWDSIQQVLRIVLNAAGGVLIGKGYLQNLQIDLQQRTVALYTPEASFVEWLCPGCGAKNRARRGGALRCQYCSQPFSK